MNAQSVLYNTLSWNTFDSTARKQLWTTKHSANRLTGRTYTCRSIALDSLLLDQCQGTVVQAFMPPISTCFSDDCQRSKDVLFVLSLVIPVSAFGLISYLVLFQKHKHSLSTVSSEARIEGNKVSASYEVDSDVQDLVGRDDRGEIAYRAVGYTPWLTMREPEDECIRFFVGKVGSKLVPQSYLFSKMFSPSQLVVVRLARPLGVVFEEDKKLNAAVVAEIVEGSNAKRLADRAKLGESIDSIQVGDILRALTTTNVVFKSGALFFGAQRPERTIVVYSAAGQTWPRTAAALKRGLAADGEVTLLLERRCPDS